MMFEKSTIPIGKTATLAMILLILLAGGAWFYRVQELSVQQAVKTNLSAIVQLKVEQISKWREERLLDGIDLMNRPFLIRRIAKWLQKSPESDAESILEELQAVQGKHDYADVLLVDPEGRLLKSLAGENIVHLEYASALASAMRERKPVFVELQRGIHYQTPHISVVVPLFTLDGQTRGPLGAIILVSNASQFLYPLIQSWPAPSKSAETVLVQRDGEEVLYLNDLRHRPNSALNLRIPLSRTDLTSVMAVLGKEGIVEGRDYRNIKVLSVIQPVPASPWFMVAKIDAAEAFAEWRFRAILILSLLLSLVGLTGVFALVVWQQEKKTITACSTNPKLPCA
ncbi:hypothetical protein DSCO28_14330 [Desulfosarcina ovata subsp. sediminis]|uniref:Cache domain-containing protein n=1 Tax=Desulfosarcina ovata subsp. sediminis TaxID=885957 RepID=A0A5K7ZLH2_9BACT|nr:cache domain-containing protein [Desulfosarcina ovata]BBO80867.1 hypothetical protein DSCO28_14330 [Desulfosarcina ovata subsp. sediminis]